MGSEASSSDNASVVTEKNDGRSSHSRKKSGKSSRKIHKAEREKRKRDHMNVLFLELGKTLEPSHQNHGKASIVTDTIRLLRDLLDQIDCLKKENATLLSESHYVTIEKDELQEENSSLESQIMKLHSEIGERAHSNSSWNLSPSHAQCSTNAPQVLEDQTVLPAIDHTSQPGQVMGPVFIVPLPQDPQSYSKPEATSNISKPRARYPSSSDSWPSQILAKQQELTGDSQHLICSNSSS